MIEVQATKVGYYGLKRKAEGEIFHIKSEKEFSSRWMMKRAEVPHDAHASKKAAPHHAKAKVKGKASKAKAGHAEPEMEEVGDEQSDEQEPSGDAEVI